MKSTGKPNDPISKFSLSIFRLNGFLMRNGDRITQSLGQSSARWQVLGRTGFAPQTVAQMARSMGHARQSVQRVADVLAKEGLVVYKDNPADQRAKLLELTPRGVQALAAIYESYSQWQAEIAGKLDLAQLESIADVLDGIADNLETNELNVK